jgi:hypothetical protein
MWALIRKNGLDQTFYLTVGLRFHRRPRGLGALSRTPDGDANVEAPSFLSWTVFIEEASLHTIKQRFGFERFSKKVSGAGRDRFIVQLPVRQSRDQDYRCHAALILKLSYQVESTRSGHINVRDDTVEKEQVGRGQERLCRGKRLGAIANGTHQIHQGRAQASSSSTTATRGFLTVCSLARCERSFERHRENTPSSRSLSRRQIGIRGNAEGYGAA